MRFATSSSCGWRRRAEAPSKALPEALDPLGQRLRTPAERRVHRRFVSAHRLVAGHGAFGQGVLGEVRAQARHSAGKVAHVHADERALLAQVSCSSRLFMRPKVGNGSACHAGRVERRHNHESRLSFPYLTRHRSWMLWACAFGQLARTWRSSRQLGVAGLFHQAGDVVAAAAAARLALDREGRDAEIREGVGVIAHGSGFGSGRLLHKVAGTVVRLHPGHPHRCFRWRRFVGGAGGDASPLLPAKLGANIPAGQARRLGRRSC